jgi:hypothetical protein
LFSELRTGRTRPGDGVDSDDSVDSPAGGGAAGGGAAARWLSAWRRIRTVAGWLLTGLAVLLVWFALVAPNEITRFTPAAFLRLPVEGLVLVALAAALRGRTTRVVVAAVLGVLLGLLTIVKLLDMVLFVALNRPFNPIIDRGYVRSAERLLTDAVGHHDAVTFLTVATVLDIALLVFIPLSVVRLSRLVSRHRRTSLRAAAALGIVWVLCAVLGVHVVSGTPIAASTVSGVAYEQARQVRAGLQDHQDFLHSAAVDPFRDTSGSQLLTALRGKDVIVAVVESYGQVAVQGSSFAPGVDAVLDAGTSSLNAAGFSSRSAFLTSPTFGGISWLAHSTFESGLWIDNQQRYNDLVTTDRLTLSGAFKRAGWRTVGDVPSNDTDWPEGTNFYHYDTIYDTRNLGYHGPKFGYATMPDQYILATFQHMELDKPNHSPVMSEIDLVSSHTPWAPLPRMVDWNQLGDGSIFDPMPAQGHKATDIWPDPSKVQAAYGQSIQYTLSALISFVQNYHDSNLVLVLFGDHQPATIVSGQGANHDVPISIIAQDPTVMNDISGWGWQAGLRPGPQAPVWPMSAFRDRFLTAFGSQSTPSPAHH